jgi:hypothetical protein
MVFAPLLVVSGDTSSSPSIGLPNVKQIRLALSLLPPSLQAVKEGRAAGLLGALTALPLRPPVSPSVKLNEL